MCLCIGGVGGVVQSQRAPFEGQVVGDVRLCGNAKEMHAHGRCSDFVSLCFKDGHFYFRAMSVLAY